MSLSTTNARAPRKARATLRLRPPDGVATAIQAMLAATSGVDALEQLRRQGNWQQHRIVEFVDVVMRGEYLLCARARCASKVSFPRM
jgi:hypothetical protein